MKKNRYKKRESQGRHKTIYDKGFRELVPVLDKVFSEYIRLNAADINGICRCATCGKWFPWREITNGHYISRYHYSVRWDEKNCAPQCVHDNSFAGGMAHLMRRHLVEKHGLKSIEAVETRSQMQAGETAETLREKILFYRERVKELKKEKGL
jgi:hypothetical protein